MDTRADIATLPGGSAQAKEAQTRKGGGVAGTHSIGGTGGAVGADLRGRIDALVDLLRSYGRVAVGFSGGVDSTFLAAVAARCLEPEDVLLVHLDTPLVGTPERASFEAGSAHFERSGIRVIASAFDPLAVPDVASNPRDRCYRCKHACFSRIFDIAAQHGFHIVLEGSNADDALDYRPGMRAARELGARMPLMETGWHKVEERSVLAAWGYAAHDLPTGACMATRIPCGQQITHAGVRSVRACEDLLHGLGFRQVRVRLDHGVAKVRVAACELAHPALLPGIGADRVLPREVMAAFMEHGIGHVDPVVRPYMHGEGNAGNERSARHPHAPRPTQTHADA